jgi:transketolase
LGPENTRATKVKLGWPLEPEFLVPEAAGAHFRAALDRGAAWETEWQALRTRYQSASPPRAAALDGQIAGRLPAGWDSTLPSFTPKEGAVATRDASQKILDALTKTFPALVGGAADLSPSTKTLLTGSSDFSATDPGGRNFHFGVREHAMIGVLNGMALHGGLVPYGGTFLTFSDYARGAIRLAALQATRVILVFTHDSIGMGEDGPTHQPVEHLVSLRAIPGLTVLRPADANETAASWRIAIQRAGPTALIFSRQKLPVLDPATYPMIATGVPRGGYILSEAGASVPHVVLVSTGSEIPLVLEAQRKLASSGVSARVVSLPSWELFGEQPLAYRESVLPPQIPKVSVEAGVTLGWSRYVGSDGASIGVDRFGASAPGPVVQAKLGFTVEHIVEVVHQRLTEPGKDPSP